jgi:hypothetical protein
VSWAGRIGATGATAVLAVFIGPDEIAAIVPKGLSSWALAIMSWGGRIGATAATAELAVFVEPDATAATAELAIFIGTVATAAIVLWGLSL